MAGALNLRDDAGSVHAIGTQEFPEPDGGAFTALCGQSIEVSSEAYACAPDIHPVTCEGCREAFRKLYKQIVGVDRQALEQIAAGTDTD